MKFKHLIAFIVLTLICYNLAAQEKSSALVLNMQRVPIDSSGNNNNGEIVGEASIEDGKLFINNTKGRLVCKDNSSLNIGTGDITIVATVVLKQQQLDRTGIVSKGASSSVQPGYSFIYRAPHKSLYFYICDGNKKTLFRSRAVVLNDEKQHRVAISLKRGGKAIFAIDGMACLISGNSYLGKNLDSPGVDLSIGSWVKRHYLNGSVTNVQLYKKAFSKDELKRMTK
jgi:hypothetical protein